MTPGDLVTLAEASLWLKRDTSDDDSNVELIITMASGAVREYLADGIYAFTDSAGDLQYDSAGDPIGIPPQVRAGCLFLIAHMYRNPDGATTDLINPQFGYGYLPQGVVAVLYPFRIPAVA
jgi:hypothetical protein